MAFENIPGLGPAKIQELRRDGITTRSQLRLKSIFDTLPKETRMFLTYKPKRGFHRDDVKKLVAALGRRGFIPTGSYTRGEAKLGDMDFVSTLDESVVYEIVLSMGGQIISAGESKLATYMYVDTIRRYIRVDIFLCDESELPFMMFYTIGDRMLNIIFRKRAKDMGYKLNQHGLFHASGRRVANIRNEADIFEALDHEYIPPRDRGRYTARQ